MNIGILGSGEVGQTLAAGFVKHGHAVTIGTRDPAKLKVFAASQAGVRVANFAETANFGEIIVLAVKGVIAASVLRDVAPVDLIGKTIIDACNPISDAPPVNGVLKFFTTHDQSLLEQLQHEFVAANFVKAFNSVGAAKMINPRFQGGKPTMFICGNDASAKEAVTKILDQFGWETADMGEAESARAIEPLCMLWCIPGFRNNQWSHAFKLLT